MSRAPVTVSGVILAAGSSRRFGDAVPKQLSRFDGEPLVRRAARVALASRLRQILVVVGHESGAVGAVLAGLAVELVDNPAFREGQSASVRAGLTRVEPGADAALFLPVDQPLLDAALLDDLIVEFERGRRPVVVPTHAGQRRSPVLIGRQLFGRLATIEGDAGGRQLFAELAADQIAEIEVEDSRRLEDVDRLENIRRLRDGS